MRRENFNVRHPLFRPFWVRALFVGITALWTFYELAYGQAVFGVIAALSGGYLFHQFFWVFDPKDYERKEPRS